MGNYVYYGYLRRARVVDSQHENWKTFIEKQKEKNTNIIKSVKKITSQVSPTKPAGHLQVNLLSLLAFWQNPSFLHGLALQ